MVWETHKPLHIYSFCNVGLDMKHKGNKVWKICTICKLGSKREQIKVVNMELAADRQGSC